MHRKRFRIVVGVLISNNFILAKLFNNLLHYILCVRYNIWNPISSLFMCTVYTMYQYMEGVYLFVYKYNKVVNLYNIKN